MGGMYCYRFPFGHTFNFGLFFILITSSSTFLNEPMANMSFFGLVFWLCLFLCSYFKYKHSWYTVETICNLIWSKAIRIDLCISWPFHCLLLFGYLLIVIQFMIISHFHILEFVFRWGTHLNMSLFLFVCLFVCPLVKII